MRRGTPGRGGGIGGSAIGALLCLLRLVWVDLGWVVFPAWVSQAWEVDQVCPVDQEASNQVSQA